MKKVLFFASMVVALGLTSCGSSCVECKGCNDTSENAKLCKGDNGTTDQDFKNTQAAAALQDGKDGCSCSGF